MELLLDLELTSRLPPQRTQLLIGLMNPLFRGTPIFPRLLIFWLWVCSKKSIYLLRTMET